jgi:hypothetical protein
MRISDPDLGDLNNLSDGSEGRRGYEMKHDVPRYDTELDLKEKLDRATANLRYYWVLTSLQYKFYEVLNGDAVFQTVRNSVLFGSRSSRVWFDKVLIERLLSFSLDLGSCLVVGAVLAHAVKHHLRRPEEITVLCFSNTLLACS